MISISPELTILLLNIALTLSPEILLDYSALAEEIRKKSYASCKDWI